MSIGQVRVLRNGAVRRESPIVVHLSGYGITCGELGTTNGSIRLVAQLLIRYAMNVPAERMELEDDGYDFKVELESKEVDVASFTDDTLYAHLRGIYDREMTVHKAGGMPA